MPEAPSTAQRRIVIQNPHGLHARPSAAFVQTAQKFASCDIFVGRDENEKVNGKSIMGLMMLAAAHGSELYLEATGPDAEDALHALAVAADNHFGME